MRITSIVAILSFLVGTIGIEPAWSAEPVLRTYYVDASLMSIIPEAGLPSLKPSGKVGGSSGSNLGLALKNDVRNFSINIAVAMQRDRFLAYVSVAPEKTDAQTTANEKKFDLTDLRPQTYEIARDDDGRVYQLCLVPWIVEHPGPKLFDPREFHLEELNFPNSPVILNDREFLGSLGMSGAQVATIDLPGVGDLEFSLLHLKDAEPLGQLHGGILTIHHEKKSLTISNVSNGDQNQILDGGPYKVWVRWKPPTQTIGEYQAQLLAQIADLRKQAEEGDSKVPDDLLQRLKEMDTEKPPRFLSCGARRANPAELVPAK